MILEVSSSTMSSREMFVKLRRLIPAIKTKREVNTDAHGKEPTSSYSFVIVLGVGTFLEIHLQHL
jgi:hypothetical protein